MSAVSVLSRRGRTFLVPLGVFLFLLSGVIVRANVLPEDAPIIISEKDSTRAIVSAPTRNGLGAPIRVIEPNAGTRFTVYVTNLADLLEGEGASAFRADIVDSRHYRFPLEVLALEPLEDRKWVYALTLRLRADVGAVGDVLLRVNWRGVSSNRVRVSLGFEGGKIEDDPGAFPTPMPDVAPVKSESRGNLPWTGDRVRFMEQATFGVNAALESRLRRIGYSTWLEEQMEQKFTVENGVQIPRYSSFPYPNVVPLDTNIENGCPVGNAGIECRRNNYSMFPLQNWFYKEALYSEDQQLRRRVAWALHQIWVVSGRDVIQSGQMLPYIKLLDKHAFGNYRDLLYDMTLNPAMGQYLDMVSSTKNNPNENYAREILQLFSIGTDRLNIDGTVVLNAQGNPVPTYDQQDVNEFTKVFTGWTYCNNAQCPNAVPGIVNYRDPMRVNPANHDTSEKRLLRGTVLPAGQTPDEDLQQAIDNIFEHPNLAPFISKILIQQLVTSNPTPAYVRRVARAFEGFQGEEASPSYLRGDLKRTIRAILLDPEARGNLKTDPDFGKLREPVQFLVNVLRPFDPKSQAAGTAGFCNGQSDGVLNGVTSLVDQDVYNPPSVFNYYLLDYRLPSSGLAGPEFGIYSTGTALKRPNFINQFIIPGGLATAAGGVTLVNAANPNSAANGGNYVPCGTRIDLARLQPVAQADPSGALLVDTLNKELMHGSMTANMRSRILTAVQAVPQTDTLKRARTAVYLIVTSSQYQVQR